jgi:nucleoside-diphosphate-sugar epimerase
MGKKVLIIGGTGQISASLTRLLSESGHHVTIYNRSRTNVSLPPSVTVLKGDRVDREHFIQTVTAETYDTVFDFICWNPDHARVDVEAFLNRTGHFFYISSAWVYGAPQVFPIPESHPRRPVEGYGRSKNGAEEIFWKACLEHRFPLSVIRFHATYDDFAPLGGILSGDQTPLYRMKSGRPILLHDRGIQITQFLHAEDAAKALLGLMENKAASVGEAFNVAGEPLTWRDYYLRMGALFGMIPRFASIPAELIIRWCESRSWPLSGVHQFNMHLDTTKLFDALPTLRWSVPIEEGILRKIEVQRKAGINPVDVDPDPLITADIDGMISRWNRILDNSGEQDEFHDAGWKHWMLLLE